MLHCHEMAQLLLYGMTGTNSCDAHQGQANVDGMDDTDEEDNDNPDDAECYFHRLHRCKKNQNVL